MLESTEKSADKTAELKEKLSDRHKQILSIMDTNVEYYPGTDAPADYVSYIRDTEPVSMNRILSRQGYRFYQSSFDDDKKGSWLSVNYDPWGIGITYAGYILLGISMLWMLWVRTSL